MKYHVPTKMLVIVLRNLMRLFSKKSCYHQGFFAAASGFYPFGDATALAGEGGVGDVVWLIQASA